MTKKKVKIININEWRKIKGADLLREFKALSDDLVDNDKKPIKQKQ